MEVGEVALNFYVLIIKADLGPLGHFEHKDECVLYFVCHIFTLCRALK